MSGDHPDYEIELDEVEVDLDAAANAIEARRREMEAGDPHHLLGNAEDLQIDNNRLRLQVMRLQRQLEFLEERAREDAILLRQSLEELENREEVERRRARGPIVHVHRDQVEGWSRLSKEHAHYKTLAEELEKQARTDTAKLDELKARIARVEVIHRPVDEDDIEGPGIGYQPDGSGYGTIDPACLSCGQLDEYAVPWPCDTVKVLRGEV